jgi:hypothetical protein
MVHQPLTRALLLPLLLWGFGCGPTIILEGGDGGCGTDDCSPDAIGGVVTPWETMRFPFWLPENDIAPPGTLALVYGGDTPWECGALEFPPTCTFTPGWHVVIPLPPELQRPGARIDLDELRQIGIGPSLMESGGSGLCGTGSLHGTLEVLAVDASSVTIRLTETDPEFTGKRTLLRCSAG